MKSVTLTINTTAYPVRPYTQTTQAKRMVSIHDPRSDRILLIVPESISICTLESLLEVMDAPGEKLDFTALKREADAL